MLMHRTLIVFLTCLLSACASSMSGSVYKRGEARTKAAVEYGIVEAMRPIRIEGTKSHVGESAGAVIGGVGGVYGAKNGSSYGRAAAGSVGAVVGGLAGAATEEVFTRSHGYEIIVRLDSGQPIAVVQAGDETFKPGDRVLVITGDGTRVTHLPSKE
jgi:outer membrane lipoprotein SlyB